MCYRNVAVFVLAMLAIAGWTNRSEAQYRCAVAVDFKGKPVLAGQITDQQRPSTEELWKLLKTLSFSRTKEGQDIPDPNKVEKTTLKGELRVRVNGAGDITVAELNLVRNPYNSEAWIIAPEDFTRILALKKAQDEQSKK